MKKVTIFRKLLVVAAVCFAAFQANAQVTLIYPDATPSASFATIQLAYNAIDFAANAGAHTIQVESAYDASAEIYPITLGAKTGASEANAVVIKPATGVKKILAPTNKTVVYSDLNFASGATTLTVPTVTGVSVGMAVYGFGFNFFSTPFRFATVTAIGDGTITVSDAATAASIAGRKIFVGTPGTQTIVFDAAKYVTIDGVSRTGATGIEIQNPNSINCQTIYFKNNAQYNTVQNCIVRGANISGNINNGTNATIYFGGAQFNTIHNNDVCDMNDANIPYPICAFQMTAGGGANGNNTVSSNNVYNISNLHSPNGPQNFMQFGSESAAANIAVLNNRFYWTAPTTFSSAAISLMNISSTLSTGHRFEGNVIGYGSATDLNTTAELTFLGSGGTIFALANAKNFTCKNNTVANMNITGTTGTKAFVAFQIPGSGATRGNDNCYGNTVENIVLNSNGGNGTMYGFFLSAIPLFDIDVKNNVVKNLTVQSNTATHTATIYGIQHNFGASGTRAINCIGNEISNLTAGKSGSSANHLIVPIMNGGCANVIEKNLIYNINAITSGTGSTIHAMRFTTSKADGVTIKNNIIRIGNDVNSDVELSAIANTGLSSNSHPFNVYHNTIYIGGTSQTKPSHCISRAGATSGLISIQNNIFSNVRTGGAAVNQVYNLYALTDITTSEYNLYQYGSKFATVTTTSPTSFDTMAAWEADKTLVEMGSKNQLDPQFVGATGISTPDMHVAASSPANEAGQAIALVTDDFAGAIRADYVTPSTTNADLGALVISNSTAFDVTKQNSVVNVLGMQNTIQFFNLSGKNASIYSFAGQLLKSVQLKSDNVTVAVAKGLYLVTVDGEVSKVMVK